MNPADILSAGIHRLVFRSDTMEFISSLIPLFVILSIIISIVNKAKKTKGNTSNTATARSANTSQKYQSLKEAIMQQIQAQKNAANPQPSKPQPQQMSQPRFGEGNYTNLNSLENTPVEQQKHAHNAHLNKSYNEGESLNRKTLENVPTEMQRHAHKDHVGGSYNEGDALNRGSLEGVPLAIDMDSFDDQEVLSAKKIAKRINKPKRSLNATGEFRALKMNRNSIVNGIIMSEILNSRGGRKATK